jgi:hypothetical protein
MMQDGLFFLLLLFFIELAETSQYKGMTFSIAVNNLYRLYKQQFFRFLLFHTSLVYVIYITVNYELFNIWTVTIILTKAADFCMKLYLFRRIDQRGYFNLESYGMGDIVLDWKLRYLSVVVYVGLFIPGVF